VNARSRHRKKVRSGVSRARSASDRPSEIIGVVAQVAQAMQARHLPAQVVDVARQLVGGVADLVPQGARGLADDVAGQLEIVLHLAEGAVEIVVLGGVAVPASSGWSRRGAGP
jgi:hypothetical protein